MGEVEQLRQSLDIFCSLRKDDSSAEDIPDELEKVLDRIAKHGELPYTMKWPQVSQLIKQKVLYCVAFMNDKRRYSGPLEEYEETLDVILNQVHIFDEPPFTIQRVCELLIDPGRHYASTDKYMRALQKNLLVVSGWRRQPEADILAEKEKECCQDEKEEQVEPDSTSEPSTPAPHRTTVSQDVPQEDIENAAPDSTTVEEKPEEERPFLERPKKEVNDENDEDAFVGLIKCNSSQRKVALGSSKIQINVGVGKNEPVEKEEDENMETDLKMDSVTEEITKEFENAATEESKEPETEIQKETAVDENEIATITADQEALERKRKRSEEEETAVEEELPPTPQKVQKTE